MGRHVAGRDDVLGQYSAQGRAQGDALASLNR